MGEEKYRLSHVPDFALGEKWLILRHEVDSVRRRHVVVVDDREAGGIEVELYGFDAAARNRRSNGAAVQHSGKNNIVCVSCAAGCLSDSILARYARANCIHRVKMSQCVTPR